MNAVYEEFLKELELVQKRARGDKRKELIRLLLIALEREKLVTISYRESLMASRLQEMPLPEDAKALFRHALIWIYRDEDMHTVFTRGALMRIGGRWLKIKTLITQSTGALSGWAASVVQHVRFRRAPVGWTAARIITKIGKLAGKVPREVRKHVKYSSFREFCQFNIDAELTAQVCWERIVILAEQIPEFNDSMLDDLRRVAFDEDRHGKIFGIIADSLDDQNQLLPGVTPADLIRQIKDVSDYFLPREFRDLDPQAAPLGHGGKVFVTEDHENRGKTASWQQALEKSDLLESLKAACLRLNKSPAELEIAVKVTFIMGTHRKDISPVNDPATVEQFARWMQENGYRKVSILESDNIYDHFFDNREAGKVGAYFGFGSEHYDLVSISKDLEPHRYTRGMGSYAVCKTWKHADFRITFGKLRSHPTELAMIGLGNLEWMGSRVEEFIFMDRQADRHTVLMMLLDDFPVHYSLVEGYDHCPDGLIGMMGCKNPVHPRRFYLGRDALAVDMVAARHMGMKVLPQSGMLNSVRQWFGGWSTGIEVHGTDEPIENWRNPVENRFWALLSLMSFPMYMLFSNRGSYFVAEMDEVAFPPKTRPGFMTRFLRKLNRRIIGLHFGKESLKV